MDIRVKMQHYVLVDADVGGGANTAGSQSLEYDRGIQSGEATPTHVLPDVDPSKAQLCRLPAHLHREYLLN